MTNNNVVHILAMPLLVMVMGLGLQTRANIIPEGVTEELSPGK